MELQETIPYLFARRKTQQSSEVAQLSSLSPKVDVRCLQEHKQRGVKCG